MKDRVCEVCKEQVEDEIHFLIKCPCYKEQRVTLFNKLEKEFKNFRNLNDENKFIWLLSSEDKIVIMAVYKLLSDLFEKRKELLINNTVSESQCAS